CARRGVEDGAELGVPDVVLREYRLQRVVAAVRLGPVAEGAPAYPFPRGLARLASLVAGRREVGRRGRRGGPGRAGLCHGTPQPGQLIPIRQSFTTDSDLTALVRASVTRFR